MTWGLRAVHIGESEYFAAFIEVRASTNVLLHSRTFSDSMVSNCKAFLSAIVEAAKDARVRPSVAFSRWPQPSYRSPERVLYCICKGTRPFSQKTHFLNGCLNEIRRKAELALLLLSRRLGMVSFRTGQ